MLAHCCSAALVVLHSESTSPVLGAQMLREVRAQAVYPSIAPAHSGTVELGPRLARRLAAQLGTHRTLRPTGAERNELGSARTFVTAAVRLRPHALQRGQVFHHARGVAGAAEPAVVHAIIAAAARAHHRALRQDAIDDLGRGDRLIGSAIGGTCVAATRCAASTRARACACARARARARSLSFATRVTAAGSIVPARDHEPESAHEPDPQRSHHALVHRTTLPKPGARNNTGRSDLASKKWSLCSRYCAPGTSSARIIFSRRAPTSSSAVAALLRSSGRPSALSNGTLPMPQP